MDRPQPRSLWEATAPAGPALPRLAGDRVTDVAIVGGGFTGLAAARRLAARGIECTVLEQETVGFGGSGRNAGSIVPRYKKSYVELARKFGDDTARRLHRCVHDAIETIEQIVDEHAIDCGFRRCGQLTAAHRPDGVAVLEAEAAWLRSVAGYGHYSVLDAAAVARELATGAYFGGGLDAQGGFLQPLTYARGFAAALARNGVPIFVGTEARRIVAEPDRVTVETDGGTVRAKRVLVATNAYTAPGVAPGALERRMVAVSSSVLVTEPALADGVPLANPGRRHFIDTKRLVNYGYGLADGRLLFGGRGDITGRSDSPSTYRILEQALAAMFPQMAGIGIAYRWSGLVAMTLDDFPHLGRVDDRVFYAMGYGGRGVVFAHLLGNAAADLMLGEPGDLPAAFTAPFPQFPLHALRIPMMKLAAGWFGLRDRLDRWRHGAPPTHGKEF